MIANVLDTEETAKLKKRLGRENNASLGLFTNPDGTKCTPKESAKIMVETHFPKSTPNPPDRERVPLADEVDITDPAASFLTLESVKTSINTFKSLKGAGPSNIKPLATYKYLSN